MINIKMIILVVAGSIFMNGCTQMITAPIAIAGATASAVIDVAGSTVHAVAGKDD
ncbi:MAG: hypothetical protein PHE73_08030 [Sulfurovaceae bacterium]|nr:hypothetical protein [Sulfurovaceae bacterium]